MSKIESLENNSCVKAGCSSPSCCHDINIYLHPHEIALFPHAKIDNWGVERQMESGGDTLYYSYPEGMDEGKRYIKGHIVGECENVRTTPTGIKYCGKYIDRPDACKQLKRGGVGCNTCRNTDSLPPVSEDLVEK